MPSPMIVTSIVYRLLKSKVIVSWYLHSSLGVNIIGTSSFYGDSFEVGSRT